MFDCPASGCRQLVRLHALLEPYATVTACYHWLLITVSSPVKNPRTTNSTGNTVHFFMTVMFGSGTSRTALGMMCSVLLNHHAAVWFSTCPLKGIDASRRSNADCLSVVTISILSSSSYVSRTLPCYSSSSRQQHTMTNLRHVVRPGEIMTALGSSNLHCLALSTRTMDTVCVLLSCSIIQKQHCCTWSNCVAAGSSASLPPSCWELAGLSP